MATNPKPVYRRILLKLSGEALQCEKGGGIDTTILNRVAKEVKELVELDVQIGIVIGGGNLFRGSILARSGINRVISDQMGMLATVINGLAIYDALHHINVDAHVMSAISLEGICADYNWADAINKLDQGYVLIFTSGTGNPFSTTDSAACLRGIEMEADIVLKATKVDGVFAKDPIANPEAELYDRLSYHAVLERGLQVMDLAAFILARDHKMPIRVFNMKKLGALRRVVMGQAEGTLIGDVMK
ncbi:uridylate kinase [Candidatus Photodesmus blepharus]|uniref:Uridylate kinase n=1 Tax=Candidatus Photodesmus blepharonis TaxID=1179155 RepID=M9NIU1_9GAMM|nr:UMP kinase [Candidatus Photodesmus blepharus]AFJ93039.1 uridylate kinase [Candidatus Photodesmus blepharus]KEY91505.1 uridylate kinase [Candidatus Photodesmus blepharus]